MARWLYRPRPWPRRCALCRDWSSQALCEDCRALVDRPRPRCLRCGLGLSLAGAPCSACATHPPPVAWTLVGADYAFPWDGLIQRLKFAQELALADLLAQQMAQQLAQQLEPLQAPHRAPPVGQHLAPLALSPNAAAPVTLVLPVPLHARRLRERGFNQAWELARRLARQLQLPARADALLRHRDTGHQAELPAAQRWQNVQQAFMPDPQHGRLLRGQHVALVDDVMTTGATAYAAALAAKEAGAASVALWVAARTPAPEA